jgi:Mg-chelatase subunit ChlD
MIDFEKPQYFILFLLIPIWFMVEKNYKKWQNKTQENFGDKNAIEKLKISNKTELNLKWLMPILIFCLVIALVNPKIGNATENIKDSGIELVLAVDVSKSMLCQDVQPNRLEKAKQIANQIISNLKSDRVGIVTYASSANTTLPMTTDYAMAKMQINSLNTDMISSQGTGIKNAIEASVSYFDNPKASKVVVILSDGEDHEDDASSISTYAKEKNVKLITIGIGTEKGGNIAYLDELGNTQLKQDNEGNVVVTKLNAEILKEIAKNTEGNYIDVKATNLVINEIKNNLSKIEKSEFKTKKLNQKQAQFQWFLGIALIILVLIFVSNLLKNKLF